MNSIHYADNPLDSPRMNAFAILARIGLISEIACELFRTHSAIGHAVSTLQAELSCRLLTRMNKRISPTEEDEALLRQVNRGLKAQGQGAPEP